MFSEARKLNLIEEMIKLKSEKALKQIERIVKTSASVNVTSRPSASIFSGKISKQDIALMDKAINEGCEQINPDDWK